MSQKFGKTAKNYKKVTLQKYLLDFSLAAFFVAVLTLVLN